ncbi:MAG TPA: UDP-N-acetylmuramoyl-tripeptide--D-alanyl-D-alanine ligase, partial [Anaerolineales bacterium]|nr:UDP-N-acetylmuramoyl-tripeptide--D-alanyl-D-alanine ligase [Anaerolineales bacterium]
MLTLADIIEALTARRPAWAKAIVTDASIDSRQVIPGALFVALPGQRVVGHPLRCNHVSPLCNAFGARTCGPKLSAI